MSNEQYPPTPGEPSGSDPYGPPPSSAGGWGSDAPAGGSYGTPPPTPGYGGGGYGGPPAGSPYGGGSGGGGSMDHPKTTTILVLGIISVLCCQLLGPVAWYMGHQARNETKANPSYNQNNTVLTIGWVLGIIATVLFVLGIILNITGVTAGLLSA